MPGIWKRRWMMCWGSEKMKKLCCVILLFVMLGAYASTFALEYNDVKYQMGYQDVLNVLDGLSIDQKVSENSKSISIKNNEYIIYYRFSEDKVSAIRFQKLGNTTSSLNLFDPDWSLEIDDIIDLLENENAEYSYQLRVSNYTFINGKRVKLDSPEPVYTVRCYGFLDDYPAEYDLTFNVNGELVKIELGPSGIKEENSKSNYLILLAYLGEVFGPPMEAKTQDWKRFLSEDGGSILEDTCYWEHNGLRYTIVIETLIEQDSEEDEPFKGDFYKNVNLIISEIEE